MIGVPSTGRTLLRRHLIKFHHHRAFQVISLDDYCEIMAQRSKTKLVDAREKHLTDAGSYAANQYRMAIARGQNIIVDIDELLTPQQREAWIKQIPDTYEKIAFVMVPATTHQERNEKRKDYPIKWEEIKQALRDFVQPTTDEGFDEIIERRM